MLKKTADVSANVVEHKYGNVAGDCVRDATDTARNVFRTLSYVTVWLHVTGVTKFVAKSTGRIHVAQQRQEQSQNQDGKVYNVSIERKWMTMHRQNDEPHLWIVSMSTRQRHVALHRQEHSQQ